MKILINGETHHFDTSALTVPQALLELGEGMAVALNGAVVPRSQWAETTLTEGDSLEVLTAVQGG